MPVGVLSAHATKRGREGRREGERGHGEERRLVL
jgi:hypothetical protein